MKKTFLLLAILLITTSVFAQQEKELKLNEETNLIEATYYHDNGVISQEGTYNLDGKLQGKWMSFDTNGQKTAVGYYDNGVKTGKWFFWSDKTLSEVDYSESRIHKVNVWTNKETLATRN